MRSVNNPKKEAAEKLKRDIERFLANGGVIQQVPYGVTTSKEDNNFTEPPLQEVSSR